MTEKSLNALQKFREWLIGQIDITPIAGTAEIAPLPDELRAFDAILVARNVTQHAIDGARKYMAKADAKAVSIKQEADAEIEALRRLYRGRIAELNERIVDLETQIDLLKAKG